jgi:hypothetical protein
LGEDQTVVDVVPRKQLTVLGLVCCLLGQCRLNGVVTNLHEAGMPLEVISSVTGLAGEVTRAHSSTSPPNGPAASSAPWPIVSALSGQTEPPAATTVRPQARRRQNLTALVARYSFGYTSRHPEDREAEEGRP